MDAVMVALDWPARGLGRILGWLRRALTHGKPVIRSAPDRAHESAREEEPQTPPPADDSEDTAPCEPAGAILRPTVAHAKPAVVIAPIREGLSEVPPLP